MPHAHRFIRLAALVASLSLSLLLMPAPARAQVDKPLRILVGFPPGGSADMIARMLADRLRATPGAQNVVVENRPGAAGRIAIEQLKNAAPDGSTVIVMPSGPVVVFPHVFSKLTYDPVKDLTPISQLADFQFAVVSGPKSNVKSMAEMIALARTQPASAQYGSPGNGTLPHFLGLMIGEAAGIRLDHVPYQGGAPALNDLLGGQIAYNLDVVSESLEQHRAGKLRIIAVSGPRRSPLLPQVPTLREQGVPMEATAWFAMYGPAGLPREVVQRLNTAVLAALNDKALKDRLSDLGFDVIGSSPEQLAAIQKTDSFSTTS